MSDIFALNNNNNNNNFNSNYFTNSNSNVNVPQQLKKLESFNRNSSIRDSNHINNANSQEIFSFQGINSNHQISNHNSNFQEQHHKQDDPTEYQQQWQLHQSKQLDTERQSQLQLKRQSLELNQQLQISSLHEPLTSRGTFGQQQSQQSQQLQLQQQQYQEQQQQQYQYQQQQQQQQHFQQQEQQFQQQSHLQQQQPSQFNSNISQGIGQSGVNQIHSSNIKHLAKEQKRYFIDEFREFPSQLQQQQQYQNNSTSKIVGNQQNIQRLPSFRRDSLGNQNDLAEEKIIYKDQYNSQFRPTANFKSGQEANQNMPSSSQQQSLVEEKPKQRSKATDFLNFPQMRIRGNSKSEWQQDGPQQSIENQQQQQQSEVMKQSDISQEFEIKKDSYLAKVNGSNSKTYEFNNKINGYEAQRQSNGSQNESKNNADELRFSDKKITSPVKEERRSNSNDQNEINTKEKKSHNSLASNDKQKRDSQKITSNNDIPANNQYKSLPISSIIKNPQNNLQLHDQDHSNFINSYQQPQTQRQRIFDGISYLDYNRQRDSNRSSHNSNNPQQIKKDGVQMNNKISTTPNKPKVDSQQRDSAQSVPLSEQNPEELDNYLEQKYGRKSYEIRNDPSLQNLASFQQKKEKSKPVENVNRQNRDLSQNKNNNNNKFESINDLRYSRLSSILYCNLCEILTLDTSELHDLVCQRSKADIKRLSNEERIFYFDTRLQSASQFLKMFANKISIKKIKLYTDFLAENAFELSKLGNINTFNNQNQKPIEIVEQMKLFQSKTNDVIAKEGILSFSQEQRSLQEELQIIQEIAISIAQRKLNILDTQQLLNMNSKNIQ